MTVNCCRCGCEGDAAWPSPPEGWEGTVTEAVCPGCQYAEWHPHCTSVVDLGGDRVNVSAIPRDEWDSNSVFRCEYIDLTVSWVGGEDWPRSWQCPDCGGAEFEAVHRDYQASNLRGTSSWGEVEEQP